MCIERNNSYNPKGIFYSFSIYNVLLSCGTATHEGIFAFMQEILKEDIWRDRLPAYVRENFTVLRSHAELNAHFVASKLWNKPNANILNIYEALGNIGTLRKSTLYDLIELEKKIELEQTIELATHTTYLRQLLAQGEQVVLIEDTYWDYNTVRQQLKKIVPDLATLPIYLSSTYQVSKRDGSMFEFVREKEGIDTRKWIHIGSDCELDVVVPNRYGIQTKLIPKMSMFPLERECLSRDMKNACVQQIIGISKNLRATRGTGKSVPWQIGSSEIGPLLYTYVQWILQDAMERHIRRLYFIARDGYILQQIADIIIKKKGLPLATHYIYGSRSAWRMQSYDGKPGSLRRLVAVYFPERITSVENFANIMRLSVEDLLIYLPQKYHKLRRQWSIGDVAMCVQHLEDNETFRAWYKEQMRPNRERVVDYLKQEVDVSDGVFAFVDVLGGGYTENCLAELMGDVHGGDNYTYMLRTDAIYYHPRCVLLNFLPTKIRGEMIFELSCRALHRQTEDYCMKNGKMVPVFSKETSEPLRAYGYDEFLQGIIDYALVRSEKKDISSTIDLSWFIFYLNSLVENPDEETLSFFGDMPYNTTGREKEVRLYAPKLDKQNIRDVYLWHAGKSWSRYYSGSDIEFALLRCTPAERMRITRYKENRVAILERYERFIHRKIFRAGYGFKQQLRTILPMFNNQRVVLYGAGKYGRWVYRYLYLTGHKPVLWLDKNAVELKAHGFNVDGDMLLLEQAVYDVVLIAVADKYDVLHIKKDMVKLGVPQNLIFGIAETVNYMNRYFSSENLYPRMYRIKL